MASAMRSLKPAIRAPKSRARDATGHVSVQGVRNRLGGLEDVQFAYALARAIRPVHTPLDGDTIFAVATGTRALVDSVLTLAMLGALAADVVARAVARGVYLALSSKGLADMPLSWKDRFGG